MADFQVHSDRLSGKRKMHRRQLALQRHWVRQKAMNRLPQKKSMGQVQPLHLQFLQRRRGQTWQQRHL